jgi:hypothetical protein
MPFLFDASANRHHGQKQNPEHYPVPPVFLIFIISSGLFQAVALLNEFVSILFQFRRAVGQLPFHFIQHSFGRGRMAAQIGQSDIRRFLVVAYEVMKLLRLGISGGSEVFQQRACLLPVSASV